MQPLRVIGLGQRLAGDDSAGLAVVSRLRELLPAAAPQADVECRIVAEPSALVPLLWTTRRVLVVDAVLAEPEGQVRKVKLEELYAQAPNSMSSHGLRVDQAIELAHLTDPDKVSSHILILGITIAKPVRFQAGLSPKVAAAVERAALHILELV